jgi:hypothetical protein
MKFSKHRRSQHFARVTVPSPAQVDTVAGNEIASMPAVVAAAFIRIRLAQRVRVLRRLLLPVGPLALVVVGGGAFAKFARQARWARMSVSLHDAARITSSQVFELVRYVEQSNPAALRRVLAVLMRDATFRSPILGQ